uniref:Uncharacterized protein n=1 Tax=Wolbachia endosymbiont of Oeneis ivallda TaxID=3171168 RepID=A0AAU7YMD7_9RICK
MPNKSEINRELVRAFNVVLHYNDAIATNLVVEKGSYKDHIVISFDKNMNKEQCMNYLNKLKGSIVNVFYNGDEDTQYNFAKLSFDMNSFPFKCDKKFLEKDIKGKYKFSMPIDNKVVFNLKCLLANEFAANAKRALIKEYDEEYVVEHGGCEEIEVKDKKTYLYAIDFDLDDKKLQDHFKNSLLSEIGKHTKCPKESLEIKDNEIYIKSNIFDEIEFINSIVRNTSMVEYRIFEVSNSDDLPSVDRKFSLVDLFCKAGTLVNTIMRVPCSDAIRPKFVTKGEKSILIPGSNYGSDKLIILKREEADHLNKIFGMDVLNNMEDYIDDDARSDLKLTGEGIYAIDCADRDITYCVMNKVIESSVINKDHKLSIDPARVPAMKPQTLAPSEEKVGTDGPSADSGFGGSPKNSAIGKSHTGNSSKFLRPDYYGEGKGGGDASAKDSGFGHSSARSSARSSFNKPKTIFNQSSISQPDQSSSKKRTSTCCIL